MQFKVIASLGRIQKEAEALIFDIVFCGLLFWHHRHLLHIVPLHCFASVLYTAKGNPIQCSIHLNLFITLLLGTKPVSMFYPICVITRVNCMDI